MGQKVNPKSYRIGILYDWQSLWYADKHLYSKLVGADHKVRNFLSKRLKLAGVVSIEIKRSINTLDIYLYVTRPGVVIGRGGSNIELLKKELLAELIKIDPKNIPTVNLHPMEVKNADLSAKIMAETIAQQLEKRYPHRRAKDQAFEKATNAGAQGVKIVFSGRIGGAEIARREKYSVGKIPTSTLRADIDYAQAAALTRSGYVGIKVWIYKGEKQPK